MSFATSVEKDHSTDSCGTTFKLDFFDALVCTNRLLGKSKYALKCKLEDGWFKEAIEGL